MARLITLTTDFGLTDGFVGVMKGVILSINPNAVMVDITHGIASQDVRQGAFLLANSVPYFPASVIHLCVVDPGVGSTRRAIAVELGETIFIAPDNGVASLALERLQSKHTVRPRGFHLNKPRYWLPRVSNTFHGRDVFSPCAAHISRGVPLEELGTPIEDWTSLPEAEPTWQPDGAIAGHVIYIDKYGNIVTDIDEARLGDAEPSHVALEIRGREFRGLVRTYSDVARGDFALLIGSPWKLEIAQREGNAAQSLGVRVGDPVVVRCK